MSDFWKQKLVAFQGPISKIEILYFEYSIGAKASELIMSFN